jgi:hypothetical protein
MSTLINRRSFVSLCSLVPATCGSAMALSAEVKAAGRDARIARRGGSRIIRRTIGSCVAMAVISFGLAANSAEAQPATAPTPPGRPKIVNHTFYSAQGQILRGDHLFLTGTTGNTRGDEFTLNPRAWRENADIGFNLRRVWVSGAEANDEPKFRKIDRCVELAAEAGQYIILLYGPNDPKALRPPGSDHQKEFWSIAAARYKDRTHVIYDVYNEPVDSWPIDPAGGQAIRAVYLWPKWSATLRPTRLSSSSATCGYQGPPLITSNSMTISGRSMDVLGVGQMRWLGFTATTT